MVRRVPPRAARWLFSTVTSGTCAVLLVLLAFVTPAGAQQKRIYIALDDHTDFLWTADEATYRQAFLDSLDYYLNLADTTAGNATEYQSRFNTDGSFWMWTYEKNKTAADFDRLIGRVRDGHITVPLNGLVSTYGAQPAEAVLRGMYYPGQIERRYNLRFSMVEAMENQTLPLGLSSLWAGAGAKYSWRGVCGCATSVPNLGNRKYEIYRYTGLDGASVIMKWNSLLGSNTSIGGYAEARDPTSVVNLVDTNATFISKYPYSVIGAFGKGWDDLETLTNQFVTLAPTLTTANRKVIVSNESDFFADFDTTYGAGLPSLTQSFGNEWDLYSASMAEVSSSVRRSVEKLRGAEGLATLVSLVDPTFWTSRKTARDLASMDLGLYWEHDWTGGGTVPNATRAAWQRRLAGEISSYVDTLQSDGVTALGALIPAQTGTERFFVYNPLSWARNDMADIPRSDSSPVHVVEVSSGLEVPSQLVVVDGQQRLRILATAVPALGYKVFEIRPGAGAAFPPAATVANGVMDNGLVQVTVASRGAITSLVDEQRGNRQLAQTVGGKVINDLGSATGTLTVENSGPVSVTLKATASAPIAHDSRITLIQGLDRVDIRNDINQNFTDVRTWAFGFNLASPDVHHEEVGAVLRAKLLANGGHYSPANARYSWLTLNHFADMTDGTGVAGVTLSNTDTSFMQLGASTSSTLDTTTPQISPLAGGQVDGALLGMTGQNGDTHFLQRFALRGHGAYDEAGAMRFSLEHQNPFVTGTVTGVSGYPADSYSFLSISDPSVLLWALKPAEEGIDQGIVARVWNLGSGASSFSLALAPTIASAEHATHIETPLDPATVTAGVLTEAAPAHGMVTYRLQPGSAAGSLPSADAQSVTTGEDTPTAITLTGSDPEGEALTYAVVTPPAHGVLGGTAPSLTYAPAADYNGPDSFSFTVTNTSGFASPPAAVAITVTPVNDPPTANAQSVTVSSGGSASITLTASDPDGDTLTYAVATGPAHGALTGTPPSLTYTPVAGYGGPDSFTFTATDPSGASSTATVSITVIVNNPPVANGQTVSTNEDVSLPLVLTGSDPDGGALTFAVVTGPAHGVLTGTAPSLTYTPATNYNGPDSFTFRVTDNGGLTSTATVSITVVPVNDPPVANAQSVSVQAEGSVPVTLTGSDVDGDALTFTVTVAPAHGAVTGTPPSVTYVPAAGYFGADSFTFRASDPSNASSTAVVTITVLDNPPVAGPQSVTTNEDTAAPVVLTASDLDGGALTYAVVTSPTHGALTGTAPSLTYTPVANYNGSDSFTFRVTDNGALTSTATVSITVTPVNDPPVANAQSVTVATGASVPITLTGSDVDGGALTFAVATSPAHGTLTGTPPALTYTAATGYTGPDSFTFTVTDTSGASSTATVGITVTSGAPNWWNNAWSQRRKLVFNAAARTTNLVSFPVLVKLDSTRIDYTATQATGADLRFIDADGSTVLPYEIEQWNPGGTSFVWVTVPQIDAGSSTDNIWMYFGNPAAPAGQNAVSVWSSSYRGVWHLTDFTDSTGKGHTGTNQASTADTAPLIGGARRFNGTSQRVEIAQATDLSFTQANPFTLTAWVKLDSASTAWRGIVTKSRSAFPWYGFWLDPTNHFIAGGPTNVNGSVAPTAQWVHLAIVQDGSTRRIYVNGVQAASGTSQAANGTGPLWIGGAASVTEYFQGAIDEVRLAAVARTQDWLAAENLSERDSFVTFVADSTPTAPTIQTNPASQTVTAGQTATFSVVATGSAPLAYQWQQNGTNVPGAIASSYTTPATTTGDNGATFRCVVSNGAGSATSASATLTVQAPNQPPVANAQSVTTAEDTATGITLTGSDPEGSALTFAVVTSPAHGVLTGTTPSLTYAPAGNYSGADSFTFKVTDSGGLASPVATVSITVTPVNDPPVANGQSVTTSESAAVGITLTGSDPEGDALTYAVATGPAHGTLTGTPPSLTYTPTTAYNGPDSFTFTVTDTGALSSAPATVSITVTPVNHPPVANGQTVSTNEDVSLPLVLTGSDPDGGALTFAVVTGPAHGVLTGTAPNLTYTPATNYNGADSFTFRVTDNGGLTSTATVSITVIPVNDPPVANAQSVSVQAEGSVPVTLTGSDVDGDALTFTVTVAPAHGAVTGTPPSVTYVPAAGYFGADSFTFRASDPSNASSTAVVTITVLDNPPVAGPQSVTTNEDTAAPLVLTASDLDGGALTYAVVTSPAHGALTGTAPSLTYTPAANYNGPDSFTFRVTDNGALTSTAAVSITVTPVNDPPVANAQSVTVATGASVPVTLTGSDVDGGALTFAVATSPAHGTLTGTPPALTYTAATGYTGPDSFTFTVTDTSGASSTATVGITVTSGAPNWWNNAWSQRRKLVFNATARTTNLVSFPVLVKLDSTRIDYTVTQATGADLRFIDADGSTVLPYEIEQWNPGGTSFVWVTVPQIDAGSSTDNIWMYFGNPAAPAGQNAVSVWSSSYRGVWHLTDFTDSTGKGHTGTNQASTADTAPLIGGARRFNGTSQRVEIAQATDLSFTQANPFTLTAWVKLDSASTAWRGIVTKSRSAFPWYGFWLDPTNHFIAGGPTNVNGSVAPTAQWVHLAIVQDGSTRRIYVNGVQAASGTSQAANGTGPLWIGGAASVTEYFQGAIDEVRLAAVARTQDWLAAEVLSQSGSFITFTTE